MAEQFLSRLTEIESSIASLGETLKRMVTLLSALNEIKSEVRIATEQIMTAIQTIPQTQAQAGVQEATLATIRGDLASLNTSVNSALESFRQEMQTMVQNIPVPASAPIAAPPTTPTPAPAPTPAPTPAPAPAQVTPAPVEAPIVTGGSLSPHGSMGIAAQLEAIVATLKMGCKAGTVLDQMASSKAEIIKIVPSDPIMVKIDKWNGIVAAVPRRKELQARDILKIKKEMKKEIKRYQPA
ncbi:MAG: hypothetical protein KAW94_04175 [Candidatus Thorarchaeota archaeon]|nr:hypothetical protein [Candidatus Thorarchaeota archaeon]